MRLITILFLCSRLLSSLSQQPSQEIDCNDHDVLMAVDAALKNVNNGNQTNNLFVLYRVGNITKLDGIDPLYFLKYQIKEGDCPVQSGKTWQDCAYKQSADAATGECTATVEKEKKRIFTVATQTCHITPAEGPAVIFQHSCPDCKYTISTEDPKVKEFLKHAVSHFNKNSNHSHLFDNENTERASTQDSAECTESAHIDFSHRIASNSQKCNIAPEGAFFPRFCAGCPVNLPLNSSNMNKLLSLTSIQLNAAINSIFYFKIANVKRATSQLVAGMSYYIEFTAEETTCSKGNNTDFSSSCAVKEPGTQGKTEEPIPTPSPPSRAQPGVAVTSPDFQDSDLFAAVMLNPSTAPTESDDDWIPNIQELLPSCEYQVRARGAESGILEGAVSAQVQKRPVTVMVQSQKAAGSWANQQPEARGGITTRPGYGQLPA
ncbi:PREDICTED: kininogen-1-like [Condylura cristata]|uniref:kininogen-1-like n=1 Tax=Condylura cristata TaxID=143302 RepID=UPI000643A4D8|nr:PREDICTED: kininogen-1-like [Condylura cristata]